MFLSNVISNLKVLENGTAVVVENNWHKGEAVECSCCCGVLDMDKDANFICSNCDEEKFALMELGQTYDEFIPATREKSGYWVVKTRI